MGKKVNAAGVCSGEAREPQRGCPGPRAHSIRERRAVARTRRWVPGRSRERLRGPGRGKAAAGRAGAQLPASPPFPSSPLPEAAGRAGAVPGVGGLGGEEAGPPHWLLPAPPARSPSERSLGQLWGAGAGAQRSVALSVRSRTQLEAERCRGRLAMGAGAAGCAMDGPRLLLLLLLLLLGVSASLRAACALSSDWNPNGFPERKQNGAFGSQMLGVDGGRGAPLPGSTAERLGFSERRSDPKTKGRDAGERGARMRVLRYGGACEWRS